MLESVRRDKNKIYNHFTMKKIQFEIIINASAEQVYKTMLGINAIDTYNQWTAEFNPTSTYEGT